MNEECLSKIPTAAMLDPAAKTFVWTIWVIMSVAALGFVYNYSNNIPYADEWALVPYLTGRVPITARALWEQHNEHRLPVPKLILLELLRLTHGDFRVGRYCTIVVLSALSFGMIHVARSIRGITSYGDAFFPLLLLNWGHCENFLWSWQIQFSLFNVFLGTVFLLLVLKGQQLSAANGFVAGVCLIMATYCGGQSLPFVVLLGGWLVIVGISQLLASPATSRYNSVIVLFMGVAALVAVGLNFVGFKHNPGDYYAEPNPAVRSILKTSLEILVMSLGSAAQHEYSENFLLPYSWVLLVGLLFVALAHLLVVGYRQRLERLRALGLLFFLGAIAGLVLAIARARAGRDQLAGNGLANRYVTMMIPALYSIYFIFTLYTPTRWRTFAEICLFTIICSLTIFNNYKGIEFARKRLDWENKFLADIAAGEPIYKLARNYNRYFTYELEQEPFADCLRMLHGAKIGPFHDLHENPSFREVKVSLESAGFVGVRWQNGVAQLVTPNGYLDFSMAEPKFIAGIRVHICYLDRKCGRIALSHCNNGRDADDPAGIVVPWTRKALLIEGGLPRFQISWKTPEQPDFTEIDWGDNTIPRWQDEKYMAPSDEEQTVTVWIADIIDRFRIYPDKPLFPSSQTQDNSDPSGFQPFDFVISKIELLVEQD